MLIDLQINSRSLILNTAILKGWSSLLNGVWVIFDEEVSAVELYVWTWILQKQGAFAVIGRVWYGRLALGGASTKDYEGEIAFVLIYLCQSFQSFA